MHVRVREGVRTHLREREREGEREREREREVMRSGRSGRGSPGDRSAGCKRGVTSAIKRLLDEDAL